MVSVGVEDFSEATLWKNADNLHGSKINERLKDEFLDAGWFHAAITCWNLDTSSPGVNIVRPGP